MAAAKKKNRHNQETILYILMGLIIISLIISGYLLFVGKILPGLANANNPKIASNTAQVDKSQNKQNMSDRFIPPENAQSILVYFAAKGKDCLASEIRKVRKSKILLEQAKSIISVLLSGPVSNELYNPIPAKTTLRGIFFSKGHFTVDLSNEFKTESINGPSDDVLAIYSIVNSLTELDENVKVKFLINGVEVESIHNNIDLSEPIGRNSSLITK